MINANLPLAIQPQFRVGPSTLPPSLPVQAESAIDLAELARESESPVVSALVAALTAALVANFGGTESDECCCVRENTPATAPVAPSGGKAPQAPPPPPSSVPDASRPAPVAESTPNAQGYAFPVQGYRGDVALHHGSNRGGSDIFAPRGTPVVAMRGGTVLNVGTSGVGGNNVMIQGDDGLQYYYAHMDQTPMVQQGAKVAPGAQLGVVGDSGNAQGTGTHLHIGIGPSIVTGVGPAGGTGGDFDAVGLLNQALPG